MKKIIIPIIIFLLITFAYIYFTHTTNKNKVPPLKVEEQKLVLNNIYIYGTHLGLTGKINILDDYDDIKLTLYNGDFKDYAVNYDNGIITISENINDGLYLDPLDVGTYYAFLKVARTITTKEGNEELKYQYYIIDNETNYKNMTYYTISNTNNKIKINSDNNYNTLMFNINNTKEKNIYDITIDPGHGGRDNGAEALGVREADLTMKIATSLKKKLENLNLKIKLTHQEKQLSSSETMNEYGTHGRAVIPNEVHSKYTLSIHLNSNSSSKPHGLEIYTPVNINYDFANILAKNIIEKTGITPSTNKINKKYDAIYSRNFTTKEIEEDNNKKTSKGYKAYDITEKSNYYYMIRETGGNMTGAYVDGRNPEISEGNPYYNSNIGNETYLLELGYLTNESDLNIITTKIEEYTTAIAEALKENLKLS